MTVKFSYTLTKLVKNASCGGSIQSTSHKHVQYSLSSVAISLRRDFFLLTRRYQDHKVELPPRLVSIPITPTGITDHGVIQAGGGWKEKQELPDMTSDPLLPHTKRLSSLTCQLTKRWKIPFLRHRIRRKKRTHDRIVFTN